MAELTPEQKRERAMGERALGRTTAFAQMGSGVEIGANPYTSTDQFLSYLQTTDPVAKAAALQEINRNLNRLPGPAGFDGTQFDYMQTLLRRGGFSKAKTPIGGGFIGPEDAAGLDKAIAAAYASSKDPLTYLSEYNATLVAKGPKQQDTTTKYTKQIQTALQFKDLGDARQYYSDSYFAAFGKYPEAELDKKFQDSWNANVTSQNRPTTTEGKTEYAPIYDKKSKPVMDKATGEQKKDKFGNLVFSKISVNESGQKQYKPTTTGISTAEGEGFTTEEQKQFLATFLSENYPATDFSKGDVGGSAKSIYDAVVELHRDNYVTPPSFAAVSGLISQVIGSADEKVQTELLNQYYSDIQNNSLTRFNSLSSVLKPGENASKYMAPVLTSISTALEREIAADSDIAKEIFNFKGEDGKYRMPNDFELSKFIKSRPEYGKTSAAINDSINIAQSLKNALG
jgi:hypothetical protein